MAVAAERPADTDGGIESIGASGVKVGGAEIVAVAAEVVDLMLRDAQLEILGQFESNSHRTVKRDRNHGRGVSDLGNVATEGKRRLKKNEEVARKSASERLDLHVTADEIACEGGASRCGSAGAGGLRKSASAEVRLVVRGRDGEIGVAANPVFREEHSFAGIRGGRTR